MENLRTSDLLDVRRPLNFTFQHVESWRSYSAGLIHRQLYFKIIKLYLQQHHKKWMYMLTSVCLFNSPESFLFVLPALKKRAHFQHSAPPGNLTA
jgi:hypothetical protein